MKNSPNEQRLKKPLFIISLKYKLVLLLMAVTVFRLYAKDNYAQKIQITLEVSNTSVGRIIDRIESTTDFHFVYKTKDVDLDRKLSLHVQDENIQTVLERMFKSSLTAYKVKGTHIILKKRLAKPQLPEVKGAS
ncbi:STN domain-containing protein [Echinicola strongylocentroti]|nr:STN domain-containing protein [Echinicola strongylocentroti]